jgi:hypothetical protein
VFVSGQPLYVFSTAEKGLQNEVSPAGRNKEILNRFYIPWRDIFLQGYRLNEATRDEQGMDESICAIFF